MCRIFNARMKSMKITVDSIHWIEIKMHEEIFVISTGKLTTSMCMRATLAAATIRWTCGVVSSNFAIFKITAKISIFENNIIIDNIDMKQCLLFNLNSMYVGSQNSTLSIQSKA